MSSSKELNLSFNLNQTCPRPDLSLNEQILFSPGTQAFSPGSTVKTKLRLTSFCFLLALRRFLLAGEKQIQA